MKTTGHALDTSWIMHAIHEQKRGLAKLLATENITVCHEHVETASFDVKERILRLPLWESLTTAQYDLLIGHEVGHAKYTPYESDVWKDIVAQPGLHTYVNVLEDIRIERMMQEAYPGLRPAFRQGYADFYQSGPLFESSTLRPVHTYDLIDRINLHAKIGVHCAIPFDASERVILSEAYATRSFHDVVTLAKRLYTAQQSQNQNQGQGQSQDQGQDQGQGQGQDQGQGQGQDQGQSQDQGQDQGQEPSTAAQDERSSSTQGSTSEEAPDASGANGPVAETDQQNTQALRAYTRAQYASQSNDVPLRYDAAFPTWTTEDYHRAGHLHPVDVTISRWQTSDDYRKHTPAIETYMDRRLAAFDAAHKSTIMLLSQEFTRKQSAKLREKSRVSRTGVLNTTSLASYRFREDLFRRVRILPKGKKHGVVVLVDGSGSMYPYLSDVYEQALLFAEFARTVRIPCLVAVFGERQGYWLTHAEQESTLTARRLTVCPDPKAELRIILDTTSAVPWRDQRRYVARLLVHAERNSRGARVPRGSHAIDLPDWLGGTEATSSASLWYTYHAGHGVTGTYYAGTPLVGGALVAESLIRTLHHQHRVEKSTLVVLSDGGATDAYAGIGGDHALRALRGRTGVVRDPYTSRTVPACHLDENNGLHEEPRLRASAQDQLQATYQIMQARWGTRTIGLGLVPTSGRRAQGTVESMIAAMSRDGRANLFDLPVLFDRIKQEKLAVLTNLSAPMYDLSVLLASTSLHLLDDEFESLDTSTMNAAQIVRAFKKSQTGRVANRRLVQTIVPFLA